MAAPVSGVVECYEGKRVTTWYAAGATTPASTAGASAPPGRKVAAGSRLLPRAGGQGRARGDPHRRAPRRDRAGPHRPDVRGARRGVACGRDARARLVAQHRDRLPLGAELPSAPGVRGAARRVGLPHADRALAQRAGQQEGLSRRNANKIQAVLHAIFERALEHHNLHENPAAGVRKLRESYDAARFEFYTPEEVRKLATTPPIAATTRRPSAG